MSHSRQRLLPVARAVAWRNLHNYFTKPSNFLPGLLFPLLSFMAFAGGLSAVTRVPGFGFSSGYTAFQYVFVLIQSAAFAGVFTGFSIARDFETGFGRRLLLAAPRRRAIIAGYALAGLGRWLFTASVVTAIAFAAGMNVTGSASDLFGLYTLALLANAVALLWATGIAMLFRTVQAGPLMQTPVFLILFLAPVYFPLGLLRGWIHAVAQANPATYVLEAGRGFISGNPVNVAIAFAALAALLVVFTLWALWGLKKAEAAGG